MSTQLRSTFRKEALESLSSPEDHNRVTSVVSSSFELVRQGLSGLLKQRSSKKKIHRRVKTKTVLQMESTECGAASLAMVLAHFGRVVSLEELRSACGVSRDGSKALNIVKAARAYGLVVKPTRCAPETLVSAAMPAIVFWNFNHFLVLEGFKGDLIYLNDPAYGRRTVSWEEFGRSFTGVAMTFMKGTGFAEGGREKSLLQQLWRHVSAKQRLFWWVVALGAALFVPGLLLPMLIRYFVDEVLLHGGRELMHVLVLALAGTAGVRALLSFLREHALLKLEQGLATSSAQEFYWHLLRLPMEFFAQRHTGEVGARVRLHDQLADLAAGQLSRTMLDVVAAVVLLGVLFTYDWLLASIALFISLLNILLMRYGAERIRHSSQRVVEDQGKLYGATVAGVSNIEAIKSSGNEDDFFAKLTGRQAKLVQSEQEAGVTTQTFASLPLLLAALNTAVILAVGSWRVMEGHLTYGSLLAFQGLAASFLAPITNLVQFGGKVETIKACMDRIEDVLRYDPVPSIPAEFDLPAKAETTLAPKLEGRLELRGISFGYSRVDPPLIKDFSANLEPGKQIALLGGSGSGKTTIARLAAGMYQPWDGAVYLDGQERSGLERARISHSMGMVDQVISLFAGSIRDNISLWADLSEADITAAAKDACILDEILERPGGFDHLVDEDGRNFSGGQRQRLEIARALAVNPRVLIMDEATSALDAATERQVLSNLRRRGCSCLFVAHRLSTVRDSDEIIVLQQGEVAQRGTHDELKGCDGLYRQLMSLE